MQTTTASGIGEYWLARRDKLFLASCIALIVTAMSFAIRGALIDPLGKQFNLTNEQLGLITGTAFWGFALATIIGGYLCDVIGMRTILAIAFIGHAIGIATTIFASGFTTLFLGTLAFGLANGCVEAACNPLIATLYPDQKIKRLGLFHVWFPGGIVIGGLIAYAITSAKVGGDSGWKIQMATMILPLIAYGILFIGQQFPKTERTASGVSSGQMLNECLRPFFLLFVICMTMTAATELVTGQWMPSIVSVTTGIDGGGILFLCWVNGLMAVGRTFAGTLVHRMSPLVVLLGSAIFSAIGIFLLTQASGAAPAAVATTLFAIGVCFFWPTMLGVVNERFPKTGALGMSIMGGAGMLSTAIWLPIVGGKRDAAIAAAKQSGLTEAAAAAAGGRAGLQLLVSLPIILIVAFLGIYLYDKSKGGYQKEILVQDQEGHDRAVVNASDPQGATVR